MVINGYRFLLTRWSFAARVLGQVGRRSNETERIRRSPIALRRDRTSDRFAAGSILYKPGKLSTAARSSSIEQAGIPLGQTHYQGAGKRVHVENVPLTCSQRFRMKSATPAATSSCGV